MSNGVCYCLFIYTLWFVMFVAIQHFMMSLVQFYLLDLLCFSNHATVPCAQECALSTGHLAGLHLRVCVQKLCSCRGLGQL